MTNTFTNSNRKVKLLFQLDIPFSEVREYKLYVKTDTESVVGEVELISVTQNGNTLISILLTAFDLNFKSYTVSLLNNNKVLYSETVHRTIEEVKETLSDRILSNIEEEYIFDASEKTIEIQIDENIEDLSNYLSVLNTSTWISAQVNKSSISIKVTENHYDLDRRTRLRFISDELNTRKEKLVIVTQYGVKK